ncbi:MAG: CAP domain-containing protein, partial [Pseudomonadota bacterium]
NLGAGYVSFDHALDGWKGSPDHDQNLLNKHVTRMGIARVQRPDGRYRNFWVLIMARPASDGRPTL